jgi:hypothetical protein
MATSVDLSVGSDEFATDDVWRYLHFCFFLSETDFAFAFFGFRIPSKSS